MNALLRNSLMAPLWAAQLATGAKSFIDNPIIGNRWLNEHGLHVLRVRLAFALAAFRRLQLAHRVPAEDRAAFARDGFIMKRNYLPAGQFAAIRQEVQAYRGSVREMVQGDTITRRIALDGPTLARMPAMSAMLERPDWRWPIRYVGASAAEPIHYIQSILTHFRQDQPDPQLSLHEDAFHPSVKAWLFLDDVAEDAAPFTYVPGSHRLTPARLDWERRKSIGARSADRLTGRGSFRIEESELAALGLPPPMRCAVPANTLVVADTVGFHARGPSVRPTCRVEIWAYGRGNPFLPWAGIDLWRLTGLGKHRAGWFWGWGDQVERHGGRRATWQERRDSTAYDPA